MTLLVQHTNMSHLGGNLGDQWTKYGFSRGSAGTITSGLPTSYYRSLLTCHLNKLSSIWASTDTSIVVLARTDPLKFPRKQLRDDQNNILCRSTSFGDVFITRRLTIYASVRPILRLNQLMEWTQARSILL